jgi:O-antigen ligase
MKKLSFDNFLDRYKFFSVYLLYLIPVALVTGPFFSDLFLSLIGLFFLLYSIRNKLWNYYKNIFVKLFTIFYVWLIIRSLLSQEIIYSLDGTLFYFRYLFFALSVFYLFNNIPNLARNLGLSIFFTLLVVGSDGYLQWISGYNIFGWTAADRVDRLAGFFRDELILGGYLARLTPVALGLLVYAYKPTRNKIIIGLFFLIFIDVLIFGTGERAAFFFITLFSILLIFLSNNYKIYRLITFVISVSIITAVTLYVPASNLKVKETLNQASTNTLVPLAPYSPLHEEHYIIALKIFADNPMFGQAPNMFDILCLEDRYYYSLEGCTSHPHNSYIQLLAETGIIGFLFLLTAFIFVSIILLKHFLSMFNIYNNKIPEYMVFLMSGLFIMLWPLIPTGSFFNNWTNVMYYLPVGFVLHYFYKDKI